MSIKPLARTMKQVRFYVAYSVGDGYRIIDQDDRFSTWLDHLTAANAVVICKLLNEAQQGMK